MPLFCWFDHFLDSSAKICQFFLLFFAKFKTSQRHSEINWPLGRMSTTPYQSFSPRPTTLIIVLEVKRLSLMSTVNEILISLISTVEISWGSWSKLFCKHFLQDWKCYLCLEILLSKHLYPAFEIMSGKK